MNRLFSLNFSRNRDEGQNPDEGESTADTVKQVSASAPETSSKMHVPHLDLGQLNDLFGSVIRRAGQALSNAGTNLSWSKMYPGLSADENYSIGDMLLCKNNVCVHTKDDKQHHAGYLTVHCASASGERKTLLLTWTPNSALTRKLSPDNVPSRPTELSIQQESDKADSEGGNNEEETCRNLAVNFLFFVRV